jgi:hypothetical protein
MTTLRIPMRGTDRTMADIAVAQVAFMMLRWSSRRTVKSAPTHEDLKFRREFELKRATVPFSSSMFR